MTRCPRPDWRSGCVTTILTSTNSDSARATNGSTENSGVPKKAIGTGEIEDICLISGPFNSVSLRQHSKPKLQGR